MDICNEVKHPNTQSKTQQDFSGIRLREVNLRLRGHVHADKDSGMFCEKQVLHHRSAEHKLVRLAQHFFLTWIMHVQFKN